MAGGANSNFGRAFLTQAGFLQSENANGDTSPQAPRGPVSYTPASPNVYSPAFSSIQQAPIQQGITPLMQQIMQRQSAPYSSGLAGLYATFNRPAQQSVAMPAQMPAYRPAALNYRPNMQPAQASLGRVAKSVILQQKEAAEAELARMQEAEEQRLAAESQNSYNQYSGG